jgi:hypothetical protein
MENPGNVSPTDALRSKEYENRPGIQGLSNGVGAEPPAKVAGCSAL